MQVPIRMARVLAAASTTASTPQRAARGTLTVAEAAHRKKWPGTVERAAVEGRATVRVLRSLHEALYGVRPSLGSASASAASYGGGADAAGRAKGAALAEAIISRGCGDAPRGHGDDGAARSPGARRGARAEALLAAALLVTAAVGWPPNTRAAAARECRAPRTISTTVWSPAARARSPAPSTTAGSYAAPRARSRRPARRHAQGGRRADRGLRDETRGRSRGRAGLE